MAYFLPIIPIWAEEQQKEGYTSFFFDLISSADFNVFRWTGLDDSALYWTWWWCHRVGRPFRRNRTQLCWMDGGDTAGRKANRQMSIPLKLRLSDRGFVKSQYNQWEGNEEDRATAEEEKTLKWFSATAAAVVDNSTTVLLRRFAEEINRCYRWCSFIVFSQMLLHMTWRNEWEGGTVRDGREVENHQRQKADQGNS